MSGMLIDEMYGSWRITVLGDGKPRGPVELTFSNLQRGERHKIRCQNKSRAKDKIDLFKERLAPSAASSGFEPSWQGIKTASY